MTTKEDIARFVKCFEEDYSELLTEYEKDSEFVQNVKIMNKWIYKHEVVSLQEAFCEAKERVDAVESGNLDNTESDKKMKEAAICVRAINNLEPLIEIKTNEKDL